MSLVNNSANNFKDFLDAIKPYLNYQFYDLSGQGVEANNFSTDEKVIGTWIDGKPLYQKTVSCGALPNNATKSVAHNISSIDKIVNIMGTGFFTDGTSIPLPLLYNSAYNDYNTKMTANKTEILFLNNGDRSNVTAYVTLQYTKTTDTPVASGEKIVGQWIDGKPVFEKVIIGTMPVCSTAGTEVTKDIPIGASVDSVIKCDCIFEFGDYAYTNMYFEHSAGYRARMSFCVNGDSSKPNTITIYNGNPNWNSRDLAIIIRYTKSS